MTRPRPPSTGLLPAVVQDRLTGQVRALAWMTPEAVAQAEQRGRAELHEGPSIPIHAVVSDCDGDAVLVLVDGDDPACSAGHSACFAGVAGIDGRLEAPAREPFLNELARTIAERRRSTADESYTKTLLSAGAGKIGAKLREEADELARAVAQESLERVASEAGDVLYHLLVALELRGVSLKRVIEVLAGRSGTSGHDEKAARPRADRS